MIMIVAIVGATINWKRRTMVVTMDGARMNGAMEPDIEKIIQNSVKITKKFTFYNQ